MPSKYGNDSFYHSAAWYRVSRAYMQSKNYICERCGKPAVICHHKNYLDDMNVHDPKVALNTDNLEALCIKCHNAEHMKNVEHVNRDDHNIPVFDSAGNMTEVINKTYNPEDQNSIDSIVEQARKLSSVVSCEKLNNLE